MAALSLTTAQNLFKIKYGKISDNVYNSYNVLLGRMQKKYDLTGRRLEISVPFGFNGGVGAGSLPTANVATYNMAQITPKKVYSVVQIDREAMKASLNDEGSFVNGMKHIAQKGVESWMRNGSRILFNQTSGDLGTIQANATGTAAAPVIIITAATWKEANWEENDFVNFSTDASVFSVVTVAPATRTITLARQSGTLDLTATGSGLIGYMQNSKDNDPNGLKGVCDATTGTLYGVTVGRRWQSTQLAAGGAGITADLLNQQVLEVERKSGKTPNLIIMSYVQFRKYLNLLEDQKTYPLDPRSSDLKGKISFKGIEFMSSAGAIPIFPERFVDDDRTYILNDNYITAYHRPDFGWFDDDGTVFLRDASADSYSARYGGYYDNYIIPTFQGVITGLAT